MWILTRGTTLTRTSLKVKTHTNRVSAGKVVVVVVRNSEFFWSMGKVAVILARARGLEYGKVSDEDVRG